MRLIASDIDGTILGHDGKISARTVDAFRAAEDAGLEIVFVTGRPPRWLGPLREQIGHTGTVICSNGAVVYDLVRERVMSSHLLPLASVLEARRVIKGLVPDAEFAVETLDGFHLEPGFLEPGSVDLLAEVTPAPLPETITAESAVVKFLAVTRKSTADAFLARVRPQIDRLLAVTHSAATAAMLEMGPHGINKAVTLAEYAASRGIAAQDVVAFGDMPNDIEMLRWAGAGYAMASGHERARAATALRAPNFADDGVAQVLEERLAALKTGGRGVR
ncbi:HAD family hydrolase [Paenarthrobacter sp. PH39-S1]|uniref:HAD family hydrolase n=1 Tax=Paenarthrobacter sp. PH39-S1 TaxID=3046204 RepID=UPI0024BA4A53|nr:HAD family hydrolase [Paenarthrobacter sp. PH39-S1]MDJ0357647.1 HAD family hydrolase [Paenarthrobacter sp. PH39-S1]